MEPIANQDISAGKPVIAQKNRCVVIGIIACSILAIAGISLGVYGIVKANDILSELSDLKSQDQNDDKAASDPEVTKEVDAYEAFAENLANNYTGSVSGQYGHWTGSDNVKQTMFAHVDEHNHLKIMDASNNGQIIAEADDVLCVYFVEIGNGGEPYFYIIGKDGGVRRINISEYTDRVIEDVEGYSKIVSVIQGGDLYAWLIDINGNLYRTY